MIGVALGTFRLLGYVFADEDGRQAHMDGPITHALMAMAPELLAQLPAVEPSEVLGAKLP
jgi:quinol monooxygenase YgiN